MGRYNKESGYGKHTKAIPFDGQGQVFMVARTAAAGRQILQEMFLPFDGVNRYFTTTDAAINAMVTDRGDVVYVAPNHTETITGAAGFALDVAGGKVIGLGSGNNRPVYTISSTNNAGTITQSGNNTVIKNIVVVTNDDALTNAVVVSGDNCVTEFEHQDTSSTVEAATVVRGDTANNWSLKLKHLGFTGGNAGVSCVRLDDCDNVRIEIDAYGIFTTAVVEMVDVASTNVVVKGNFYVSGTTDLSKNVVDTITASTWAVDGFDVAAGSAFSGGSGNAVAIGDLSVIASDVLTIKGNVGGTDSATNVLGADDADNQFASTNVAANRDGSVLERLEALMDPLGGYDPVLGFRVTKTSNMADGSGTDNLFTVTGRCLITHLSGEVTTVIGTTTTMKLRDITNSVDLCAATTITTDAVGTMYALPGLSAEVLNGTGGTPVIGSVPNVTTPSSRAGQIIGDVQAALTIAHVLDGAGTGAVDWVLYYKPLTAASSIAAAA